MFILMFTPSALASKMCGSVQSFVIAIEFVSKSEMIVFPEIRIETVNWVSAPNGVPEIMLVEEQTLLDVSNDANKEIVMLPWIKAGSWTGGA